MGSERQARNTHTPPGPGRRSRHEHRLHPRGRGKTHPPPSEATPTEEARETSGEGSPRRARHQYDKRRDTRGTIYKQEMTIY
ncbi:hypothetical protein JTE90_025413 [Oedothorax gibbosus]|uniref:Uncharacterized protein n=1 Tax=Oedothorax gibbosus TaxID=931172 RepID=A0AAV6TCY4_9ARAC|nr:hypothetical protein JTE90_025413 [Oedothorax gibbosus]